MTTLTDSMSEAQLLDATLELAALTGWRTFHARPARTLHGWRTPVQGDGAGFPDLVAVRHDRLVVAELKSARGRLTPGQSQWLEAFRQIPAAEVHIWRPEHWHDGTIEGVLR